GAPPSSKLENLSDGLREALPVLFFVGKLFSAVDGQPIVASAAVVLGDAPLRADPTVLFHAVESRVERAFLDTQDVLGNHLDMESNAVAMLGAAGKGLEDEQGE